MKKALIVILSLCLSWICFAGLAEGSDADASFQLHVLDESHSGSVYMRFDIFLGEAQQGMTLACPNEGEDFIRFDVALADLYSYEKPEDLEQFRIECYLGFSDQGTPEDAILRAYSGEAVDQKWIATLAFTPEPGTLYGYRVVEDSASETGYALERLEPESAEE